VVDKSVITRGRDGRMKFKIEWGGSMVKEGVEQGSMEEDCGSLCPGMGRLLEDICVNVKHS